MLDRPLHFNADVVFLVSLVGLAESLNAVHDFFADLLRIYTTGYHLELATRNILVDGTSFLLPKFGLSNFKDPVARSSTSFKTIEFPTLRQNADF